MTERTYKIYPRDALADGSELDVISRNDAQTLDELFRERVRRSPEQVAYSEFDPQQNNWRGHTWADIALAVARWQVAFRQQGLVKGDRVSLCLENGIQWLIFDQAALRLGLVVVPIPVDEVAENQAYILADSRAKLVLLENADAWLALNNTGQDLNGLGTVLLVEGETQGKRIHGLQDWLPEHGQHLERGCAASDDLATIVYTSGTTGRAKGVMLSHKNILSNAHASLRSVPIKVRSRLLSSLPLSNMTERTLGYYAPMMAGANVHFWHAADSIADNVKLAEPHSLILDASALVRQAEQIRAHIEGLGQLRKSILLKTLDIAWKRFQYQQGQHAWQLGFVLVPLAERSLFKPLKEYLGGALECVLVSGAQVPSQVSKFFVGLGVQVLQGYGLTEASPMVSLNTPNDNRPDTIGRLIRGVEAKISPDDELCIKGDNIMLGYWGQPEATASVLQDGWLKTGDRVSVDEQGFFKIIDRIQQG